MSLDVDLTPLLSAAERQQLQRLRERVSREWFTDRELRRLLFLRWLRSREEAPRD